MKHGDGEKIPISMLFFDNMEIFNGTVVGVAVLVAVSEHALVF
jgi:hypothetical protein